MVEKKYKAQAQIEMIMILKLGGAKFKNHGGKKTKSGGRTFHQKHVLFANEMLKKWKKKNAA